MAIFNDLIIARYTTPDAVALEFQGAKTTYRGLFEQSKHVAAGLQIRKLRQGASAGLMLPNIPQFLSIAYGSFFSGFVVTPMSVLMTPREARYVITDSRLDVLFVTAELLPVIEEAILGMPRPPEIVVVGARDERHTDFLDFVDTEFEPTIKSVHFDQHMLTLYTSGTTGPSKGVMISDRNMRAQIEMLGKAFAAKEGKRILCVLPLFHAYALNAIVGMAIRNRVTIVLHTHFDPAACAKSLAHDDIHWFAGVPTMYGMLLEQGRQNADMKFNELEVCLTGGAAMNSDVLSGFETRFGVPIYEGYGLTEATVSVASNAPGHNKCKMGSVGRPYDGVDIKVVDTDGTCVTQGQTGELLVRGQNLMLGYLNRPDETAKVISGEWLRTGDLGYLDEDGFCFIVGRCKDLIIKSGYNIVPLEVEEVLRKVDGVRDAVAVGIPDVLRGERILAALIMKPGASEQAVRAEIDQTVKSLLAKYKHPNDVWFVQEFPIGASGKILKNAVRDMWIKNSIQNIALEKTHAKI
jgi:long-chain acyl-CoA synthetase